MPQKPNKLRRTLITAGLILIVIGSLAAIYVNQVNLSRRSSPQNQASTGQPGQQAGEEAGEGTSAEQSPDEAQPPEQEPLEQVDASDPPADDPTPEIGPSLAPGTSLQARTFEAGAMGDLSFGAADATSPKEVHLEISPFGAGVRSLVLSHHYQTIAKVTPTELQSEQVFSTTAPDGTETPYSMVTPFAALGVTVQGQFVSLIGSESAPTWRAIEGRRGFFEAFVDDQDGQPVLRIVRGWEVSDSSYDIALRQSIENLTDGPLIVAWSQLGPTDMPEDSVTYGGDKRRVSFGYLDKPSLNPNNLVEGKAYATQTRDRIRGKKITTPSGARVYPQEHQIWPNKKSNSRELRLVWAAMKSRYFAVAVHPLIDASQPTPNKAFEAVERIDRIIPNLGEAKWQDYVFTLRFWSGERQIRAGDSLELDMGVYAGPVHAATIAKEPEAAAAGLEKLVYFSFGGMCAFCTFQWLAGVLIGLLRFLHDYVVFDWALAIIMLVVIVRTILHPVTRWSQIRMNRFGKQMQALGPKQQKINEKYKNDPQRKQQEMAKLMREEGINPAGMLGCLPMFLQSPVWIALYATLYFAFDLQHQPAFFGVIQQLVPLNWPVLGHFLGDLSEPDRFIYFGGAGVHIPLLSDMMGSITSFNILPILLGVVFYAHQKYMTPPTTATLSPEQQQQQKIMKVMMVVMFPVIMYNAPSGLSLYFIANSTLGIFESRHIRNSAEKKGLLDVEKKPGAKPGFMSRLMELSEQQNKQRGAQRPGPRGGGSKSKGPNNKRR